MISEKTMLSLNKFENEILEVVNHFDEITTSDLQAVILTQILRAYLLGKSEN